MTIVTGSGTISGSGHNSETRGADGQGAAVMSLRAAERLIQPDSQSASLLNSILIARRLI